MCAKYLKKYITNQLTFREKSFFCIKCTIEPFDFEMKSRWGKDGSVPGRGGGQNFGLMVSDRRISFDRL